jgi:two-component system sensor histidine kinase DesK
MWTPIAGTFPMGRRFRLGPLFAGIWLVYLLGPLSTALSDHHRARGIAGAITVVAFSAVYVSTWLSVRNKRLVGLRATARKRATILVGAWLLAALAVVLIGQPGLAVMPFLTVLAMIMLPTWWALGVVAALIAAVLVLCRVIPGWVLDDQLAFSLVLTAAVMWGVLQMIQRNRELMLAQEQQAELAVSNERARFARDLHDLLGHSLTLLAMKAELAGRLVRLDPDKAEAEIAEVERLARDALADVRAAVGGYRQPTLVGELVSARAVLDAAGIDAELPPAVDDVPSERRELLAWTVREGVTNVVRHSRAQRCRITVAPDGAEVIDDGLGPDPMGKIDATGTGLLGLRERAQAAGATVLVGPSPEGGFRLRVGW